LKSARDAGLFAVLSGGDLHGLDRVIARGDRILLRGPIHSLRQRLLCRREQLLSAFILSGGLLRGAGVLRRANRLTGVAHLLHRSTRARAEKHACRDGRAGQNLSANYLKPHRSIPNDSLNQTENFALGDRSNGTLLRQDRNDYNVVTDSTARGPPGPNRKTLP